MQSRSMAVRRRPSTRRNVFNGLKLIVNYTYHSQVVHTYYSRVRFSQSGRIISPHTVNRLDFVVQTNFYSLWWEFILLVVIIQIKLSLQWPSSGSGREPGFDPRPVQVRFVVDKVALGQAFLRVLRLIHVSIIPQLLHTHLFNNTLIRKTRWQRIENFKNVKFSWISGSITQNCTFTVSCI